LLINITGISLIILYLLKYFSSANDIFGLIQIVSRRQSDLTSIEAFS
jgi:hypothetical protein